MFEHRGITCLDCQHLDLKTHPEQSKTGWGVCQASIPVTFARVQMKRNCVPYESADPALVEKRETWAASNIKLPAWQR